MHDCMHIRMNIPVSYAAVFSAFLYERQKIYSGKNT